MNTAALGALVALAVFGGVYLVRQSSSGSHPIHRTLVAPLSIRRWMRGAMEEYGQPQIVFTGVRHVPWAGDRHMPLYGFEVKGRFAVVGPRRPGRAAPRIIYDRGSVIVDSTGDPIEVAEWSSKSPNAAAEDSAFRSHFASLS